MVPTKSLRTAGIASVDSDSIGNGTGQWIRRRIGELERARLLRCYKLARAGEIGCCRKQKCVSGKPVGEQRRGNLALALRKHVDD